MKREQARSPQTPYKTLYRTLTEQEVEQENESSTGGDGSFLTGGTGAQPNRGVVKNAPDQEPEAESSSDGENPVNAAASIGKSKDDKSKDDGMWKDDGKSKDD